MMNTAANVRGTVSLAKPRPRIASLATVLATLTEDEARAVYVALGQYVENQRDHVETSDPADPSDVASLNRADAVLRRLDAEMASLAE